MSADAEPADARILAAVRSHLEQAEHGGATVVRIEHLHTLLETDGATEAPAELH